MHQYPHEERALLHRRADPLRGQVTRFLDGQLDEDEFTQLRLRNGLYMQRQAPMMRVAIPSCVLGVEKQGVARYPLTLGGRSSAGARIGQRLGTAIAKANVADVDELQHTLTELRPDA
ncbi:MAG: hypothetical protein AAGA11_02045 [Pseudomonadota bacterium]